MRLLVTRPEPEARRSADTLRGLGHDVLVAQLMTPEPLPPPDLGALDPAGWIFTSAQAPRLVTAWPGLSARHQTLPVFAVGAQTAATARASGFRDVHAADGDAAALAEAIRAGFPPAAGPLLYAAGRDRASHFDDDLRGAGFAVSTVETYAMRAAETLPDAAATALREKAIDGALFYSRRTAVIFMDIVARAGLRESIAELRCFALSEAVAAVLPRESTIVASAPDEASLFELLDPAGTAGAAPR